uniref:Secreted protein n=1 Tax=Panagrellus redivivus TaxID=6233 RepID=A0A7E4UMJ9_PANRE
MLLLIYGSCIILILSLISRIKYAQGHIGDQPSLVLTATRKQNHGPSDFVSSVVISAKCVYVYFKYKGRSMDKHVKFGFTNTVVNYALMTVVIYNNENAEEVETDDSTLNRYWSRLY